MDAIEKRARELLAAEVDRDAAAMPGVEEVATSIRDGGDGNVLFVPTALRAIISALTPPDSHVPERSVLVAATRLRKLASAATPMARSAYIKAAELIEMAVAAARPETPDSATVIVVSKDEAEELSRRRVARIEGAE